MVSGGPKAPSRYLRGGPQLDRAVVHGGRTRGKLKQEEFSPDVSKTICTVRIVKNWNRLPRLPSLCPWRFSRLDLVKPWATWLHLIPNSALSRELDYSTPERPSNLDYSMNLWKAEHWGRKVEKVRQCWGRMKKSWRMKMWWQKTEEIWLLFLSVFTGIEVDSEYTTYLLAVLLILGCHNYFVWTRFPGLDL